MNASYQVSSVFRRHLNLLADTLNFSEDAINAAKEPKGLCIVKRKIDLHDQPDGVTTNLVKFMEKYFTA